MTIFLGNKSGLFKDALIPVKQVSEDGIYAPLACRMYLGSSKIIEPPESISEFVTEYRSIFKTTIPVIHNDNGTVASYNGMGIIYSPEFGDYVVSTNDTSTTKSINGSSYSTYDSRLKRNGIIMPISHSSSNVPNIGAFKITNLSSSMFGGDSLFVQIRQKVIIMTDGDIKPTGILNAIGGQTLTDGACPAISNNTSDYSEGTNFPDNQCVYLYTDLPDLQKDYNFTAIRRIAINEGAGNYGDLNLWLVLNHVRTPLIRRASTSVDVKNMWISNPMIRLHRSNTSKKFLATIQSQSTCIYSECF